MGASGGLTVFNASVPRHDRMTALVVALILLSIVIGYNLYIHRVFRGTVRLRLGEHGH